MSVSLQAAYLFLLAIPVACISWTVTHEEVFREPRDFCVRHSRQGRSFIKRKFFYLFTCEYCFSHYVTLGMLAITKYHLLFNDWRGYLVGGFSIVWIANLYMSLFLLLRTDIKKEKLEWMKNSYQINKSGRIWILKHIGR
ncbi:MAG: hypothetical protein WDO16_23790 [Bacteroidota bacterium]